MKKLFATCLIVFVVSLFFIGCAKEAQKNGAAPASSAKTDSVSQPAGEKKKIYFVSLKTGGAAWTVAQQGFEDAVTELGWDGQYVAPTIPNDLSQMVNLMETSVTNEADGILGVFTSKDIFADVVTRAREKGIKVGSVNTNLENLENFWIGTDQIGMGTAQANALIEICDDNPCKVVYMVMDLSLPLLQNSYEAFLKGIEGHSNITVHGMEVDENNPIVAADKMNNLRKADPDINAVICTNNAGATLGVANYVDENNLQDEMYIVGIDASADILNYVKSGALDVTLDQNFYKMAYEGVMMLKTLIEGGEVAYANDSGVVKVTKEMADEYAASKGLTLDK